MGLLDKLGQKDDRKLDGIPSTLTATINHLLNGTLRSEHCLEDHQREYPEQRRRPPCCGRFRVQTMSTDVPTPYVCLKVRGRIVEE